MKSAIWTTLAGATLAFGLVEAANAQSGYDSVAPIAPVSDWVSYFDSFVGEFYYYSPGSVVRRGESVREVTYTMINRRRPELMNYRGVYRVELDCKAWTITNLQRDLLNPQTGALIGSVDVRGREGPQRFAAGDTAAYLAQQVCEAPPPQ